MWVEFDIFKTLCRLNYLDFHYIQYQCNIIIVLEMHFSQLFSSIAYFKVCFEAHKIWSPYFLNQMLA